MHPGVIERIGDTSGPQVTVVVGMPGHPAMVAPTQAEIEAAVAQQAATQAGVTIDVEPQPPLARLQAPSVKPDAPAD